MTIGLTGGTGFIGQVLLEKLVTEGQSVRLIIRKGSSARLAKKLSVETATANLNEVNSLKAALDGCCQVYHLAALAKNFDPRPENFYRVNVDGFRSLLEAALAAGVKRVVFVSSSVVKGPSSQEPVSENSTRPDISFFTDYEKSKALAEKIIPKYLDRGLEVVIARPTRVYGPGQLTEANSVTRMIRSYLKYRICLILNRGQEIGNYVYVDDVAEGLQLTMDKGRPGEGYILGGQNVSLREFYNLLEEISGRKALRLKISTSLAITIAKLETIKARKLGLYPLITTGWVKTFLENWAFSHQKAREELGYQPRNLRQGLRLTCNWLGYLNKRQKSPETGDDE
ncbi:MAG: NAD-dependent epimerase/dehydratase family protein [Acidobacteriota bacterium]|nr:NAD-dependent epimerase/dehydratase family protein [Acidobacteriota bacterium]